MNPIMDASANRRLIREISIALLFKLCALLVLWWVFIADYRVPVDAAVAGAAMLGEASVSTPDPGSAQ
ncbi:cytochrome oxidase putative small subunit CydP [Sinimarinibacterium sp. NLF-5-8]|uniref:cytochrome oxidase putative small subunit CydP n=1 Tax=Sinimarinibacterium sp. NLF-5-8 TaxID=2698684 RepID=UPI00137BB7CA|nr:cytochrome oxidase putative small subunit CydP [Sinimarinibacterium sp. NLF-5-8]QHS11222.1 hypothetical protein GT972_14420 [Sinimarinibacterium sp. NLF-5-8]